MAERIALITGANKGIGLEMARQLGEQGMTVLLGCRDAQRGATAADELRGQDIDAHVVLLDVTSDESVAAAAEQVGSEFGHLDVLVNNAGIPSIGHRRDSPSNTTIDDMMAVYQVNVFGVVRVTNAMLPLLRKGSHQRIVNMSSEIGSIDGTTNPASGVSQTGATAQYPSSKAAVNMLTVQYAKELEPEGILVNCANPGFTDTDFTQHRGVRPVQQGAEPGVHLATLPDDGPTGTFYGHLWTTEGDGDGGYGNIPW